MLPIYLLLCGIASASANFQESLHLEVAVAEKWTTEKASDGENARSKNNNTNAIDKITGDAFSYLDALDKQMGAKGEVLETFDVKSGNKRAKTMKDCAYLDEDFVEARTEPPMIIDCNYHYHGRFVKAGKDQDNFEGKKVHTEAPIVVNCNYHEGAYRVKEKASKDQMDDIFEGKKDQSDVIVEDKKNDEGLPEEQKMKEQTVVKNMDRAIPEILFCDYAKYPEEKEEKILKIVAVGNEEKKEEVVKEEGDGKKDQKDAAVDNEEKKKDLKKEMVKEKGEKGMKDIDDQKDVIFAAKKGEEVKGGEQAAVEMPCEMIADRDVELIDVDELGVVSFEASDYRKDVVKEAKKAVIDEARKKKEIAVDEAKKGMAEGRAVKSQKVRDVQKIKKAQKSQTGLIDCYYLDENFVQ